MAIPWNNGSTPHCSIPIYPRLGLISRYVNSQFDASWTHHSFLSTRVPVSSKWPRPESATLCFIRFTVSDTASAQRFTMLLTVPVASEMLNTQERISCVLFTLTAPTVFKATDNACRFSPYCTFALSSLGKFPFLVSPWSIQIGISRSWCSTTLTVTTASMTWRLSATQAVPLHIL